MFNILFKNWICFFLKMVTKEWLDAVTVDVVGLAND